MTFANIADIRVGARHRKDLGDIDALAASIEDVGLEHPIVVTPDFRLVAGQRRLEALKRLGWVDVPVRVLPLTAEEMLRAERDENEVRKDFTPTEAVAIGRDIAERERPLALERMHEGQRKGGSRKRGEVSENFAETSGSHPQVDDVVAEAVGMSRPTYQRAKYVVEAAEKDPETFGPIAEEMDRTGKVTPAYKKVKDTKEGKQERLSPTATRTRVGKGNDGPTVVENAISTLAGLTMALNRINPISLTKEEEASRWATDLSKAARTLSTFSKQLKGGRSA